MSFVAKEEDFTPTELEKGRLFFASPVDFLLGVDDLPRLPVPFPVETAFAGRSNVGKSSLLNALLGRTSLARTSNTPGRTRQLNFFSNQEKKLILVDLPGYGYAQVDKKQHKRWQTLLLSYLRGRPTLKRVFLLIDSRRGPMNGDTEILDLLDSSAVNYQFVLTKSDKISSDEKFSVIQRTLSLIDRHSAAHPRLHVTSKETKEGLDLLRAEWAEFL